jgi:hypothetical protein
MKIRPLGNELFHAGGQKYMTKLTVALRNFARAPKKVIKLDGEICMLWFHILQSQKFFFFFFFLHVNVKSMQKRHVTIWTKDIFVIFIGAQSE